MKVIRQLVSFVLGVTVGVCLYSVLKFRPLTPPRMVNGASPVGAYHPGNSLLPPWVQRSLPPQVTPPIRLNIAKHVLAASPEVLKAPPMAQRKPGIVAAAPPATPRRELAVASVPSAPQAPAAAQAPPPPTIFKAIGYVEKAGGQLEAIILQENQIQVVHLGDEIAGRYRVTRITPDLVDAIDETVVQFPMAKPGSTKPEVLTASGAGQPLALPPTAAPSQPEVWEAAAKDTLAANVQGAGPIANSLGYVQKADGKVETIVAEGESVRLVPESPAVAMAESTAPASLPEPALNNHLSTRPAAEARPTVAQVDPLVLPSEAPNASIIRDASCPVPTPAAEKSAPSQSGTTPAEAKVEAVTAFSEPTVAISTGMSAGSAETMTRRPVEMKPLGYVVKADGEFAAILSEDDEVYVVREGDRFAGHYRAVSVSANVVEAVEEPLRQGLPPPFVAPPAFPDLLSASAAQWPSVFSNQDCPDCKSNGVGEVSPNLPPEPAARVESPPPKTYMGNKLATAWANEPKSKSAAAADSEAPPDSATFIFQTLGCVETEGGERQAIVADGSQIYLVKQGETFAEKYRATSVDPILVLAVKVSPGRSAGDFLTAQTESGGKPASNKLYGFLHPPSSGMASVQTFHEVDAFGNPVLMDLGLFNSSGGFGF